MYTVTPITDATWLLTPATGKPLVLERTHTGFTMLDNNDVVKFKSDSELHAYLGQDVFLNSNEVVPYEYEYFIKGYPVNHPTPFEVDSEDTLSDYPTYTKTKSSPVHHVAGYYCLKFPMGWILTFCPKYATIKKYECSGPFKTDIEGNAEMARLRKESRL